MSSYPAEVTAFHDALSRLVAVSNLNTGLKAIDSLPDLNEHVGPDQASFPLVVLRRATVRDEAYANTEFTLTRDEHGWLALEFLAWWVRDQCRSGDAIQLRALGLPPEGPDSVQLGRTLHFVLDHFAVCPDDPGPMLALMAERAAWLNQCLNMYTSALGAAARPGTKKAAPAKKKASPAKKKAATAKKKAAPGKRKAAPGKKKAAPGKKKAAPGKK